MTLPALKVYSDGPIAVTSDNLNTFVQTAQNANQLRQVTGLDGMEVLLQGISVPGDGLGGSFRWSSSATADDDNLDVLVPVGSVPGAWLRLTTESTAGAGQIGTIADLQAATALTVPATFVYVLGYFTPGDGGEGSFFVGANVAPNGGTVINDASGRSWFRETGGLPLSIRWFGAKGDGTTDDHIAIQRTITAAIADSRAVYVPATPVYYLVNTALNLINIGQLLIFGDGNQPNPGGSSIVPGGSIIAINTGGVGIDASGAAGLIIRDLTISSVGLANASTVGVVMSNSIIAPGGGTNCGLQNVTIALKGTGLSIPFYGVNVNILSLLKVTTLGDFGWVITNTNTQSVTLPYGAFGANIQSDAVYSQGCFLNGYGTQAPFWLSNSNDGTHSQLYIHADNIGAGFTGTDYAMIIDTCNDLAIKVEIDGFPTAVLQEGTWVDIGISGIIFQGGTPVPSGQPFIASFQGTEVTNCQLAIREIGSFPSNYWYASNTTPTEIAFIGCSFIFDTAVSSLVAAFDTTALSAVPLFNLHMNGNQDGPTNTFLVNGSTMPASAYRVFINGLRTGTA